MRRTVAIAAALGAAAMAAHAAPDREDRLSVGFEYTKGDYGQAADTAITYIPVTYKVGGHPWLLGVTVPWIRVDGPANVTRETGPIGGAGTSRTESGLGDVVLAATRALALTERGGLDLTGKLKLGTASRSKGLGTGEEDIHLQLDAYAVSGSVTPFASVGYKILGDPPGIDLRNVLYADIGATRRLDAERSVGLLWHGQERTTRGGRPQSELMGFYIHRLGGPWKAQFYGILGLASGSPDYGAGAVFIHAF